MARDRVLEGRYARESGAVESRRRDHPVLALQRSIGNRAVTRLLQRAPASRVTQHQTRVGDRITGKPAEIATKFADLRNSVADDAEELLGDLTWEHLWGRSKSNVTGTGDSYSVRVDRQNPTPTHANVQIQTNGKSISVATVLVSDALGGTRDRATALAAVKAAFRASLADGMQWEVYDAPAVAKEESGKGKGKGGQGGGKGKGGKGGKGGGGRGGRGAEVGAY